VTSDKKRNLHVREKRLVACYSSLISWPLIAGAILFLGFAAAVLSQPMVASHATGFTSVEYFPAPLQQQVKSRLSGTEAQPLPGGLLLIKQLKLETFNTNGTPQAVILAPECIYDTLHYTANSEGHLQVRNGDGKMHVEGDGFLWRQNDSFLTISNHVRTVIEAGTNGNIGL
jgi:hypothetical protein